MKDNDPVLVDDEDVATNVRGAVVNWPKVLDLARRNPTKWVKVPVRLEPSVAGHISNGRYPAVDSELFQAISRDTKVDPDGKRRADIFVKVRG